MSNLTNSSAEPSYIARLALHSAPFSTAVDSRSFFNGEQIEQRLNLLFHLARSSDKVGLLIADQGVGKTTLLTQLQQGAGDDLRICRIDATASLEPSTLIEQALRAFGVEEADISQENEVLLKDRLIRLQKLNIRPLILIDNIDSISADSLATLIDWLSWQDDDEFLLQGIFTASRVMPELDNIHGRLQRVDLPNLTEHEINAYLMQRLEMAGYKAELPFSAKQLKQLYRESLGCPAAVNQLAHQMLLGIKSRPKPALMINSGTLFRWIAVLFLVITFILLLVFQDKINALFEQETQQNKDLVDQAFDAEEEPLATVVVGEDNVISLEQAERNELTSLVAELPVENNESDSLIEEQNDVVKVISNVSKGAETVTEVKQAVVEELVSELGELETSVLVHQHDWIKQQQGTDYTFQLMGSWEHEELTRFIDKYALSGDIAEFQSDRNGRVWYALIYGVYDNKKEALQASSHWPEPLNALPSWLRRFDSVQKQIKSTVQAQ